jgi:GxxExxY protein
MDTNLHECVLGREVYEVVGCALEVINRLGHGLLEKPYENALTVEFGLRGIPFRQQQRFRVTYKGVQVGEYIPDLIVYGQIVAETKVIDQVGDHELGQMINYLSITGLKVGLILNFGHPRLEWKRVVL